MSDWTMDKAKAMKDFFDRVAEGWDEGNQERSGVRESLIKSLPIKTGDRVLDVGCGTGVITGVLHSMSKEKVTAIDISPKMIEIAKSKEQPLVNEYICGDFTACDFKHSYDAAVMFNCYPHFMDREALKTALTNSLKKTVTLQLFIIMEGANYSPVISVIWTILAIFFRQKTRRFSTTTISN